LTLGLAGAKLLITGASGFVGRALAIESTARAMSGRGATRRIEGKFPANFEIVQVTGLEPDTDWANALEGVSVVAHCAARVHVIHDPSSNPLSEFRRVNVEGTLNLARQAASAGIRRLVFISSIGVNGAETFLKAFSAEDAPAPDSPYAVSKLEAEVGLQALSRSSGMEIVVIRPPLVYGSGGKGNWESLVGWIRSGVPLPLGAIHNKRSLVGIDNLVDLVLACLEHPAAANQTFLVSDGEDVSTTNLLQAMAHALGVRSRLIPVPAGLLKMAAALTGKSSMVQKLVGSLQIDTSKTRCRLNWSPPVSFAEGLRRAAAVKTEQ
jgi:nucleoside-diphosphate-sugar epimerase